MTNLTDSLCFMHVSTAQGDRAKRSKTYLNTLGEHRKLSTQRCATNDGRVGGSATKQASMVQGVQK